MARKGHFAAATATVALFAGAPPAAAQSDLYDDFQGDGRIDGCSYSPGQLQEGLNGLSPDVEQYAPGFGDQLRAGLVAQCGGGGTPTTSTTTDENGVVTPLGGGSGPPTTTEISTPAAPKPGERRVIDNVPSPTVLAAPTGSEPPDGLLPAMVAALLLALVAVLGALRVSSLGADRYTRPLRASFADAGGRTADSLAYARDLVRYGR